MSGLLIDVGCGNRPFDDGREWIHFDERLLDHVDCVGKAEELDKHFLEKSATEILARHILEHFPWRETVAVLSKWRRVLKVGGLLKIEVPNLSWQVKAMHTGETSEEELVRLMFGDQDYEGNFHKTGFTEGLLRGALTEAGMREIRVDDIGMVFVAWCIR